MKQYLILLPITACANAYAATSTTASERALFEKGAEVFKIQNEKGATPSFHVLSDGATAQALAVAVITAMNSHAEVSPKIPVHGYLDLKFQTLTLTPVSKKSPKLAATLKLTGYDLELEQTFDRDKFLAGQPIDITYPETDKTVAMFEVHASGHLRMHFDPKAKDIIIEDVRGKLNYEAPIGDDGDESIHFTGKAIRQ